MDEKAKQAPRRFSEEFKRQAVDRMRAGEGSSGLGARGREGNSQSQGVRVFGERDGAKRRLGWNLLMQLGQLAERG